MHAQNALFGLLLFGMMTLIRYRSSIKRVVLHGLLIPLPLILLIFTWWFTRGGEKEESTSGYLVKYYTGEYFSDFFIRFRLVVFDNFQLREGLVGVAIAGLIFLLIFIPILWFKPWKNYPVNRFLEARTIYPLLLLVTSLGCYLFLPDELPGQSPLFQRFCTMVLLSFIILSSVWLGKFESRSLTIFVLIAITMYSLLWFEYIYSFNKENKGFNERFFSTVKTPSRIAGLIYDHSYRGRKVYIHFPNYFVVWRHGIASSKIIDYRFGVVRRVADESVVPFYHEHVGDGYKPISTYQKLEYLLVKGNSPVNPDVNVANFKLVQRANEWKLYKNTRIDDTFARYSE
jgi:hypothetical protein